MEQLTLLLDPMTVLKLKALHDARHGPPGSGPMAGCNDIVLAGLAAVVQNLPEPTAHRYQNQLRLIE